jgi:Flp pilus assembly protein TadG
MNFLNRKGSEESKTMKKEHGQSLVELGVSLLILMYLLSGAVEFGVLFFQYVQLRDAAQEGALYGSTSIPPTGPIADTWTKIEQRARAASGSPVDLADVSKVDVYISIVDSATDTSTLVWKNYVAQNTTTFACENNGIEVKVEYKHQIFMPFIPQILNQTEIPLSAKVVDTILSPVC